MQTVGLPAEGRLKRGHVIAGRFSVKERQRVVTHRQTPSQAMSPEPGVAHRWGWAAAGGIDSQGYDGGQRRSFEGVQVERRWADGAAGRVIGHCWRLCPARRIAGKQH
jgi:hypothetical protein